ncbi:MAG TPA: hydroxyisourate hydrolase [Propionibacteriaceae bacterium]|nr:hydroxyisourate hydrolase [Propionibacteriaceae bacterium]
MSHLSAHVLDAAAGVPAAGVGVQLALRSGEHIASATTNADGRVGDLGPDRLEPGDYQITFSSGAYYADRGVDCFYPVVTVVFTVAANQSHYHVPLLLSPYSYTTYRGS